MDQEIRPQTQSLAFSPEQLSGHGDWLRRLSRRLVGQDDAEDLVQETWVAALRWPPRNAGPLRPWLAEILRNLVRSRWHKRKRSALALGAAAVEPVANRGPDEAVDLIARAELGRDLASMVLQLDEPFRSTLLLRYFDDLSAAEIARRQGIPSGTVRFRISEGHQRLRKKLDERKPRRTWMALLESLSFPQGSASRPVRGSRRPSVLTGVAAAVFIATVFLLWRLVFPARPIQGSVSIVSAPWPTPESETQPGPKDIPPNKDTTPGVSASRSYAVISGIVRDLDHAPINAARVQASMGFPFNAGLLANVPAPLSETLTDTNGRYELSVPPHDLELNVKAPGFVTSKWIVGVSHNTTKDFALAPGHRVSVRVLDAQGLPSPGVHVQLRPTQRKQGRYLSLSGDDKGRVDFDGVSRGRYQVVARGADGLIRSEPFAVSADKELDPISLTLGPGVVVKGTLRDAGAQPIVGRSITLAEASNDERRTFTNAKGEFSFPPILPGNVTLRCSGTTVLRELSLPTPGVVPVDLQLPAEDTVSGRVLDAHGQVVASALITVVIEATKEKVRSTMTDASGHFRVWLSPEAKTHVFAFHPARGAASVKLPLAKDGLINVELRLGRGSSVSGRVVTDDGKPAPGATISATEQDHGASYASATADENGRFTLHHLVASTYVVRAKRTGEPWNHWTHKERPDTRLVSLGAAEDLRDVQLVVPRGGHAISGRVHSVSGVPQAHITVLGGREEGGRPTTPSERGHQAVTDKDGHFVLSDVEAGTFSLLVLVRGLTVQRLTGITADSDDVVIKIENMATIAGHLKNADASPATTFTVFVHGRKPATETAEQAIERAQRDFARTPRTVVEATGAFRVEDLAPGAYILEAVSPEGLSAHASIDVDADGISATQDLELVLNRPAHLVGRVERAADGGPVVGATVQTTVRGARLSAVTDAKGMFTLDRLPLAQTLVVDVRPKEADLIPETAETTALVPGENRLPAIFLVPGDWNKLKSSVGLHGFSAAKRAGALEINSIQADSPADKAGLRVGDRVTEVEGKRVGDLGRNAVLSWLLKPPGQMVRIIVASPGKDPRAVTFMPTPRQRW